MGNLWSFLASVFGTSITFCGKIVLTGNTFSCCTRERPSSNEDSNIENQSDVSHHVFDDFFLSSCPVTRQHYIKKNIAYFTCDINGVATHTSDTMEDFIGLSKDENLSSIAWVSHLSGNNYEEFEQWSQHAKDRKSYIRKLHFTFPVKGKKVDRYTIVESHPKFDANRNYIGLTGILLNVPEAIWDCFEYHGFDTYVEARETHAVRSARV